MNAPSKLPKVIAGPCSSSCSKIALKISGAPLANAIRVNAAMLGGKFNLRLMLLMTVARY